MSDTKNTENESSGLKKSLRLIYVYAIAAGAIFTFIGYWDTIFYEYCGAGTFLGFILMTLLILPIAMVYCELAPLFPRAGGELIYNTVGINKIRTECRFLEVFWDLPGRRSVTLALDGSCKLEKTSGGD